MSLSPEALQNLSLLENTIWRLLARGTVDSKHAFRLCSMATVQVDDGPDTRMVVLRACDIGQKQLSLHTDIRSGKVAQLQQQPATCLLFWDPRQSLQLRVYGQATIHHLDTTANKKLDQLPVRQLALFGHSTAPGSIITSAENEDADIALAAQNFAWINLQVGRIDALHLGRTGVHTRAQFLYKEAVLEAMDFLMP